MWSFCCSIHAACHCQTNFTQWGTSPSRMYAQIKTPVFDAFGQVVKALCDGNPYHHHLNGMPRPLLFTQAVSGCAASCATIFLMGSEPTRNKWLSIARCCSTTFSWFIAKNQRVTFYASIVMCACRCTLGIYESGCLK